MLVLQTSISGAPIICGNKGKVATVDFPVFDQKKISLAGFICQKPVLDFFQPSLGIVFSNVVSIESSSIFITHQKNIVKVEKDPILKKLLNEKPLLGKKVISKNKTNYGKVNDILFDSETGGILKLYLSSWNQQLIIPVEKIISIHTDHVEIEELLGTVNPSEASV